jgi:ribosomal protein L34E
VCQYRTKKASYPKCPVSGQRLAGIKAVRPAKMSNKRMAKREKTVNRAYGGCLSHGVVRERIVRAFLIEERKVVKKARACLFVICRGINCMHQQRCHALAASALCAHSWVWSARSSRRCMPALLFVVSNACSVCCGTTGMHHQRCCTIAAAHGARVAERGA